MNAVRLLLAFALLATSAWAARADTYVLVNAANPVRSMTTKEVVDLFMGKNRSFPTGDFALAFDLPRDSTERARFYRALTGMEPAQVNSYWARLIFTGQTMPPQPLPNDSAVLDVVKRNPGAIGYVGSEPNDRGVRVVLVLKDGKP